jgi:hypothetical protein
MSALKVSLHHNYTNIYNESRPQENRSSANRNNDPSQYENDTFTTNGIPCHFQKRPNEYSKSYETKHPFEDNLS